MYSRKIFIVVICLLISCKKESSLNTNPFADEPPKNTYLADSPWPITHANPYAQASSPFAGPSENVNISKDYKSGAPGTVTMVISGTYPSGNRVVWYGNNTHVVKAKDTGSGLQIIAQKEKEGNSLGSIFSVESSLSGAYTLIDKDFTFFSPRGTSIYAYSDAVSGDENSGITLLRTFAIPPALLAADDKIVGMNLTYDGYIAFATNKGLVGVVNRSFSNFHYYKFEDEEISNSIACDEENGIYVVTSKRMYRVQWTGTKLSIDETDGGWSAEYETGSGSAGIRLGEGSGSTPTLMGFNNDDKYVVITDGQDLMHLVVLWRDKIPDNWQQLPGTKSRRIAAQLPVTFGNSAATKSLSEQSVCIRGFDILVVNNELINSTNNRLQDLISSGLPQNAPFGAEKFHWNTNSRKLTTAWVNKVVSLPNGIPCMSAATNMAYCVGQNNGIWNFTALNWSNGQIVFQYALSNELKFNSAYAATEIGLHNNLYSGMLFGVSGIWQKK